jgi:hypothetical protein
MGGSARVSFVQNKTGVSTPCGGNADFPIPSIMEGVKIDTNC